MLENLTNFIYQKTIKYKRQIKWTLAFIVPIIVMFFYSIDAFERLELLTLDGRFVLRTHKDISPDIVFIDMSEDSIEAIGRWPWPRRWHAGLVKILSDYRPRAILFDVIFSEPQDDVDDLAFSEAIKKAETVYLPMIYDFNTRDMKYLYKGENVTSVLEPIDCLKKWIKGTGHINAVPDRDGVLRRAPALITYKNENAYQAGMKIGFDILGLKNEDIIFHPDKNEILLKKSKGDSLKVPLDRNNQIIINWQARWGKDFRHFSYIDVIKSYASIKDKKLPLIDLNIFRDKICIIGLTATGLIDIKPIPLEPTYPAVGIHAMVINSILKNDFIYETPKKINMFLIFFLSILITLGLARLRFISGMALAIVCMICYAIFSVAIFNLFNIVIATFYPILAMFLSYTLTGIYTQILLSVERLHLFREATCDGLTGLYNIRHFNLLLESELKAVSLYKFRPLSIIMTDLDNFKHLNDTYGHQAGDTILKEIAKILSSKCRQADVVARYGGEEFIIMLTGANEKEACDVAEKIRLAAADKKFKFQDDTFAVTLSIGVAQYSSERNKNELIERADSALYKAKHEGKNRVCVYSPAA